MNDADVMSSAYAAYAQNLSSLGIHDNPGLIEQLQSFLKTNGLHSPSPTGNRKLSTDNLQGMDTSADRDSDVRPACRFCGKTFAQASYIKAHERLHTGEKPYVCSVCNKAFSDASNWKKHERMHSRQVQTAFEDGVVPVVTSAPPTPEPLTPSSPSMTTGQNSSAMSHSSLSSQISSFAASLSQMTATSSSPATSFPGLFPEVSLPVPVTTQSGLQLAPHLSAINSQNSQNSEDPTDLSPPAKRNKEETSRGKDDTLSCNICGKMFSTPASLSMHKKIHSGERPHICLTCGKSFTQIGTLRAHERVHTGEKPYECTICGKTFAQCGSFRMHERRHHRDMMENFQKCFVCGASFHSLEELQKHMLCHPGAFNLNLQNLHPGSLGFPGPLPLGFGFPPDLEGKGDMMKPEVSEMSDIEKAFSLFAGQPKSAPVTSLAEHFQLPPFVSTAHALIQRSLSQGSDPNTAVSMLLASNGAENLNLLGQPFNSAQGMLSPARLPILRPERAPSNSNDQLKIEEVEPVSTTTRSRKYSSDSHTSMSMNDGPLSQSDSKAKNSADEDQDADNDNDGSNKFDQCQKTPSEDSSFAESRSTEDFQSDDQQHTGVISRRNLNKRMISSSNLRKQRRPMRRLSTSAIVDQSTYQQQYNEEGEELSEDQLMVSFLLSKGEVYKCEHCHIIFEDCTLYLLHNGFHSSDTDPFKCVICKKCCDGRVEFNCHLTSHIK
ncbi:DNA-binding protein Ikaros-like [Mercenaria mercenaria]|uniref:DNA-binding protein Ikaros-like n=1 Tax=Mercenaria mercenaria TaxID=6596 RepID=UPI00234E9B94|nr:DNA-binding protein Ikaros-like [Mercenaria mercenaria]